MNDSFAELQTVSAHSPAANGCWRLAAGRAVSLQSREAGDLHIAQGRVWATLDGPHARRTGDLFLEAGETLHLPAGRRVVIEPSSANGQPATAAFDWVRAPASSTSHWPAAVAQPASDLRLALGAAGFALSASAGALARLLGGVLALVAASPGLAMGWITRRDRLTLAAPACSPGLGHEGFGKWG